jgi:argininosuccinate lyase
MTLKELQGFAKDIQEDVFGVLSLEGSLNARNHIGGTAPEQVRKAIATAKKIT